VRKETEEEQVVAFLGAGGTMGLPMARSISRAGVGVRAWNRTREKAEPLSEDGVEILDTAAEAASGATIVLTMLTDTDAVLSTMEEAVTAARSGAIWLQMSTIGIEGTERCAVLADQRDLVLVDSPVAGTKQPAEEGKLIVLASGPESTHDSLAPILEAVGQRIVWLGEAGAGTRMKLVINSWLVSILEGLAETIAFAEGIGVDPREFLETISGGPMDLPYAQLKGNAMIERRFDPAFKLSLAAKDAGLILEATERHDLELPLLETIKARLDEAAGEHGEEDMAATFLVSAPKQPARG
jgi:3-hydroxyisobutyrate dehydrogenase